MCEDQEKTVYMNLEGLLSKHISEQPFIVLPDQSIREAAEGIGIPNNQPFAATVNGQVQDLDYCLKPGDQVRLFPQISGGRK